MNDHDVTDGRRGGPVDDTLMTTGAGPCTGGRCGLGRRRLLSGVVAGTAGLLLPRHPAAGIGTRGIRFTIANKEWGDVGLAFSVFVSKKCNSCDPGKWEERSKTTLKGGTTLVFQTAAAGQYEYEAVITLYSFQLLWVYTIHAKNPSVGTPWVEIVYNPGNAGSAKKKWELGENEDTWWTNTREGANDVFLVSRRKDTSDFKEFSIELRRGKQAVRRLKDQKDKQDDKDNKDNKDRHKRSKNGQNEGAGKRRTGSGGGTDRRKRPVDRLLP